MCHKTLFVLFLLVLAATGCGGSSNSSESPLSEDRNSSESISTSIENDSSSSSSTSENGDGDSSSPAGGENDPPAQPELSLAAGVFSIQASWNVEDYDDASFNLCLADSDLAAGFANCASHDGAQYFTDISSPHLIENLSPGATYWVQLEAELLDGERLLSTVKEVTLSGDESLSQILDMGPFAGLGPLQAGSILHFYELDEATGLRIDDEPVATVAVTEKGAYTFPELNSRWIEVESSRISGENQALDLYNGGYTDVDALFVAAIFDQDSERLGQNVNVLTSWQVYRTRRLLEEGSEASLEAAHSQAAKELQEDLGLSYPPEELNFFYDLSLPKERLDDAGKLMALSSYLFRYPSYHLAVLGSYTRLRMDATHPDFESTRAALGDGSATYTNRALTRLIGEFSENDEDRFDGLLLQRTLSGCESARVWSNRTVMCLGEGTESLDIDIPSGSGNQRMDVFFHPETSGMWSLEIVMDDTCTGGWSSYGSATGNIIMMSQSFVNVRVDQKLVATRRFSPGLNRLGLRFDNDRCAATSAQLNLRQVATGAAHLTANGLYYLTVDDSHSGVVSGHVRTSGEPENASNRAYYVLVNPTDDSHTLDISIDYQANGSSAMDLILEEVTSITTFIPKSAEETHTSTGHVTKRYTIPAQSAFRVQVRQENPTTTSVDSYISHTRFNYELAVQPAQ